VPEGPLANWAVYLGFVAAIVGVVLALAIVGTGARRALNPAS
jgi:ABC-type dipeptide/oligopeptide/nickel transport system permease subunit